MKTTTYACDICKKALVSRDVCNVKVSRPLTQEFELCEAHYQSLLRWLRDGKSDSVIRYREALEHISAIDFDSTSRAINIARDALRLP